MKKDQEYLKEKKLFFQIIRRIVVISSLVAIVYFYMRNSDDSTIKNLEAFKNKQELLCKDRIVSISNGYEIFEYEKALVNKNDEIFNLRHCKKVEE